MKILLISPNCLTSPYPVYPIGLDYVAGAVSDRHQVRITDMNLTSHSDLAQILKDYSPEVVGLSCRNIDNTEAGSPLQFVAGYREFISWLRSRTKAIIVCGGSGFTIMPEALFAVLGADYGIIGEGERFGPFIDTLASGHDVTELPGVISPQRSNSYPPPWEGAQQRKLDSALPHCTFYLEKGGMLNLQTKRGCSFRCIYCPYPHIEGKKHRLQAPETVARTALHLQEAGAKYLFITDSAFNSDARHSLEVARAFKEIGIKIPWGGFFAPIKSEADYFAAMKEAGLKHVEFGTESLSSSMLQTYRKPFTVDDVFAAHRQARAAGLQVAHYFLLGGPGESAATVRESLANIELLDRAALFFFVGIRIYPNTPLYDIALSESKITPQTDLLEPVFYEADDIDRLTIETMVRKQADQRTNWLVGSGGENVAAIIRKLHERNFVGPLWEFIAR